MFNHTREAFNKVKRDLQIISWILTYGINIIMFCYYLFALISELSSVVINIILLCLTLISLVLSVVFGKKETSKKQKRLIKRSKHVLSVFKIITKAYTLCATLYAMYLSTSQTNPISIIITTILILLWIISLIVEMAAIFIEFEKNRVLDGIAKDFEFMTKAKKAISDTVDNIKDGLEGATSKVVNLFSKEEKKKLDKKA